jgi:hypothetical protein
MALTNRLPLGAVDLVALHQLPTNTLGYHSAVLVWGRLDISLESTDRAGSSIFKYRWL